ncbi:Cation/H(+) antiporter 15 [Ranunculus cassubicifolius]
MILIVVATRVMVFLLRPLRQPRVVSEILGGILLGPSGVGQINKFATSVFPMRSVMVLETMANIGLLYFLFLVGVEMDITIVKRTGREALVIAVAGMLLPFIIGSFIGFTLKPEGTNDYAFLLFLGLSVSVTAFPVLARILADLKLLNTDLGRISMSAAMINDMSAWILLAFAIAIVETKANSWSAIYVVASAVAFVVFCIFAIRPAIKWVIRHTPEGENFNEFYIMLILTGVMVCGFITDAIGTHSVFGAFVFGLVIPNGPLGTALIEKLEDFVTTLLLPLFFAISGLRTDLRSMRNVKACLVLLTIIATSCVGKVGGTLLVALYYDIPFHEGFCLGMLMNTKGLIELIILNVGRDQKVFDEQAFSIMVLTAVIMTGVTVPTVRAIYNPNRPFISNTRRTIQRSKPDAELRILACVHTPRNVPTIINLIEASHPTKKSPICVYTLHLVELTGRASAMLIVHSTHKSSGPAINRTQAQSEHIIHAFQNYSQNTGNVTVQPLTAISPYSTIHEDVCNVAGDKRVSLIIIPFHKQQTVDGGMEVTNPALRTVNQNVLANAPCSVGILIDRGFGGSTKISTEHVSHHIAVLFFGGPDDREGLSYARRMAEHPSVNLTVIRFIPSETAEPVLEHTEESRMTVDTGSDKEKQLDSDFITDFKAKIAGKERIVYSEKVANNGEETVALIRKMGSGINLYIVGRGQGVISPLTAGLTDWSECPELGAIGDLLASTDFAATVSVLVVQQHIGEGMQRDSGVTPTPDQYKPNQFNVM